MQSINITFDDEEFLRLKALKESKTWHDFIIECSEVYEKYG